MLFTTWERLKLLGILPKAGNFITMKIVHRLQQDLSFTEEEIETLQFREDGDRMMWNPDTDAPKEVVVGPKGREILGGALKKLDTDKALDHQLSQLFEKLVDTTEYDLGGEA
jgi:hypothetical protein